jgi:CRP-like cAMP-binding protein
MLSEIFRGVQLSVEEEKLIQNKLHPIQLKKGTILLRPEMEVKDQYYVKTGCLRSYFIDYQGKEHTAQFAIKDWWISDYTAFYHQRKAILFIECIQDTDLWKLSRDNMETIIAKIPTIGNHFRLKCESYISSFQRRVIGDLAKPAKQRYLDFLTDYPAIEQQVKNYHIASYLGVTTESLSRIRKELANKA